jgi:hypothetical protein
MKKWLDTFIKEKDLPMEEVFSIDKNGTCNIMSYKTIYEHILITGENEQQKIKEMIIKIDFLNGDVLKYFRHLGNAIARSTPCL